MEVRNRLIGAICLFLLGATLGAAQSASNASSTEAVPRLVKFGGVVKDDVGHARTGVVGVTFAIYKDQEGGAPLWLETQNVQADAKGNYTALLGSTKVEGLPADLFTSNEARWLGVQPEGQAEQQRVVLVSVPYALKAVDAETIGGLPPSAFVRTNSAEGSTVSASESKQHLHLQCRLKCGFQRGLEDAAAGCVDRKYGLARRHRKFCPVVDGNKPPAYSGELRAVPAGFVAAGVEYEDARGEPGS